MRIAPGQSHLVARQEMHMQGIVGTPAWRVGQFEREGFFPRTLFVLGTGHALDPLHLQRLALDTPAAGHAAPSMSRCIPTPVVVDEVAEDRPVRMVMPVQRRDRKSGV